MTTVVETTAAATRPLRLAVLRPGYPADTPTLRDPDDGTYLAAMDGDTVVGTTVLAPRPFPLRPDAPALQLTGMAIAPSQQGSGLGSQLLAAAVAHASGRRAEILWCQARTSARGFYERNGWRAEGDEFIGSIDLPHYLMWRPTGETEPILDPTSSKKT